jgi:hypothetical protein
MLREEEKKNEHGRQDNEEAFSAASISPRDGEDGNLNNGKNSGNRIGTDGERD